VANIKSQIKRNKQNNKRRLRNRIYRGSARLAVKEARLAMEGGVPESKAALLKAVSSLDRAAERGVIHKNNAARRKSRLMKAFAKLEPAQASVSAPQMVEPVVEPEVKKKTAARRRPAAKAELQPTPPAKGTSVSKAASAQKGKKPAAASTPSAKKPAAKKTTTSKKASTTSAKKGKAA